MKDRAAPEDRVAPDIEEMLWEIIDFVITRDGSGTKTNGGTRRTVEVLDSPLHLTSRYCDRNIVIEIITWRDVIITAESLNFVAAQDYFRTCVVEGDETDLLRLRVAIKLLQESG